MSRVAKAIVPSSEICCAPSVSNGLVTEMPCCAAATSMICCNAARSSGLSTPPGSWITICDEKPARSGLLAVSRSWTSLASPLGRLKSVRQSGPAALAAPQARNRMSTHAPIVSQR